ncbi:MAG: hypothetical protein Ct9H300mP19_20630 [Dehalococcoidia bacterium]|nr:MAG: hypothetical protein Ct9H300mP19_20630 [Dehalococcoidia bacterium]
MVPQRRGGLGPEFQMDQRPDDGCGLGFDSDLLEQDFEILGKPTLKCDLQLTSQ